MAQWKKKLSGSQKSSVDTQPVMLNGGLNRSGSMFDVNLNEAFDMSNMRNFKDNVLSVRAGQENHILGLNNIGSIGSFGNELHLTDEKEDFSIHWHYFNGTSLIDLGSINNIGLDVTFLEFNTDVKNLLMFGPSGAAVCDSNYHANSIATTPITNLVTIDDYRIYALIGNILKCSAEGSYDKWDPQTFPNDADSIPITSMVGTGTAICTHKDTVICWSDQSMHVLYGNSPIDFEFSESKPHGCISRKSIVQTDVTYFLDYDGYKLYNTGNNPIIVSDKIKPWLDGISKIHANKVVAGKQGKYIYLSIPYQNSVNNMTFEYNTQTGNWYKLDDGYNHFVSVGEDLYGIKSGTVLKLNTGTTNTGNPIFFSYTTGMINNAFNKQTLSSIPIIVNKPAGCTLTISANTLFNNPSFQTLYTLSDSAELQNVKINIPTDKLYDEDWYQLKFSGSGYGVEVYFLGLDKRIKLR